MSRLAERSPANWRAYDSAHLWVALALALLLIVLWMMGRGPAAGACCNKLLPLPATAAITGKAAPTVAAALGAAWGGDGKLTLTGVVTSDAAKKAIVDAAIAKYGAGNVIDQLTIDDKAAATRVVLVGIVPSEAEKAARGAWAATVYGPGVSIDNQLVVQAPATAAVAKPPAVKVYFETGKTDIDAKDRDAIATVLDYLRANPAAKAIISGFHDPRGDKAKNEALAKDRAKSVRDVLRASGIDESRIDMRKPQETTGSGDNAEARRVELTVE
jgi:outer membrane protein OmpA-like peptidoglycan-associated protein